MIITDKYSELMGVSDKCIDEFSRQNKTFTDITVEYVKQTGVLNPELSAKDRQNKVDGIASSLSEEEYDYLHSQAIELRTIELEVQDYQESKAHRTP